jgi:hypothetical protein
MHDHPGGLVHDQQMLVLVCDPEVALLGLERHVFALRGLDLDQLAALEPIALWAALTVDADRSGREQSLGLGAGADLAQRRDEAVEPLTCRVARDRTA